MPEKVVPKTEEAGRRSRAGPPRLMVAPAGGSSPPGFPR